jgi:hypothetical protein
MTRQQLHDVEPPPLPARMADWERTIKQERTLNDLVEDIHVVLYDESADYRRFLHAVRDTQAVEGSLAYDHCFASDLIRNKARDLDPNGEVAKEKLGDIGRALNVVLQRYGQSRKQRRNKLGGVILPPDDNTNSE